VKVAESPLAGRQMTAGPWRARALPLLGTRMKTQ
jgi:hypothetical protein